MTPRAGRPPPPLVRVHDGALPAREFARLAGAVRALGSENLRRTYRTTFWFELGEPTSVPEVAILALRRHLPRRVVGVEWWLSRMRTSDVQVDFHRDRDEALFARTGRTTHPVATSVLFLNRCRGGLLVVVDAPPDPANPACAPDRLDGDLVRPWPNRLAVFPGNATHGVLDARGHVPHGRLRPATAVRLALVMNAWGRRPQDVPPFSAAAGHRSLRLAEATGADPGARFTDG